MTKYAVVQERFEVIDYAELQVVLRKEGGLARADASRIARKERGILWDRFTEEEARRVAGELTHRGFRTRAMPASEIPKMERSRTIHWLEIGESELRIPAANHEIAVIDFSCVFVISAGLVVETQEVETQPKGGSRSQLLMGGECGETPS